MATPAIFKSTATPWKIVYRGAGDTSDGIVESPYFLANFDDDNLWYPAGVLNGTGVERLFFCEGTEMQLLPLFSVDAASALIQLWGFDLNTRKQYSDAGIDNESPEPRIIPDIDRGEKSEFVLEEAYNICRDDPGAPKTMGVGPAKEDIMTLEAGLVHGDKLLHDQNGETFAVAPKQILDTGGWGAFLVNVPVLSSGEVIIAVRFRSPAVGA